MNIIQALKDRTLLKETTINEINKPVCLYCGFDPTAPSLHIGNMIPLMALRLAKRLGHKTICVIGDATALIGDPTWKSETRPMLDPEVVSRNIIKIKEQMQRIADPDHIVHNLDWIGKLDALSFMRDIAARFSVNQIIAMETFDQRLSSQQHISLMEFAYPTLTAYDFLYLYEKYNCTLQCGGSDQFGNICQGIGYVKKVTKAQDIHGLTFELLVNSRGEKMGKTVSGALYLDEDIVSPYDFWQYFRNIDDADLRNVFLKLTDLNAAEIDKILADQRSPQAVLADVITEIVHGKEKATAARLKSEELFEKGNFDAAELVECKAHGFEEICVQCGFVASKSEAKRAILAGSVLVNTVRVTDPKFTVPDGAFICFGKKKFFKIKLV